MHECNLNDKNSYWRGFICYIYIFFYGVCVVSIADHVTLLNCNDEICDIDRNYNDRHVRSSIARSEK